MHEAVGQSIVGSCSVVSTIWTVGYGLPKAPNSKGKLAQLAYHRDSNSWRSLKGDELFLDQEEKRVREKESPPNVYRSSTICDAHAKKSFSPLIVN